VSGLSKLVRGLIGVVVVVVIIFTINAWYTDYKKASAKSEAVAAAKAKSSTSKDTTAVVPVQGQKVAVLADGVVLTSQAATGTKPVRALKKGETLLLVGITSNNWLQLRDAKGKFGYVANNATKVKVQK
jgi:hypothetical protein